MKNLLIAVMLMVSFSSFGNTDQEGLDFDSICKIVGVIPISPPSFTCCYYPSPVTFSRIDVGSETREIHGLRKFLDVISISIGEVFALRVFIAPPTPAPIYAMRVWIDINRDGKIDEVTEQFYSSKQCEQEKSNFQTFIVLPKDLKGYYLMRIVVEDGADWCQFSKDPPHPVGQLGEGVYSDILLNIK